MGLGSLHSSRFLQFGFRVLTEGESPEKIGRFCTAPPPPPSPIHPTITTTAANTTDSSISIANNYHNHNHHHHHSWSQQAWGGADMPAFREGAGPPPLITAGMLLGEYGGARDGEEGRVSPEGSASLSGGEGSKYSDPNFFRKQREFIPEDRKDHLYWEKRRKNNEAARRSRERRRMHDMLLESRVMDLEQDNSRLRKELKCLKKRYGIPLDAVFVGELGDTAENKKDSSSSPSDIKSAGGSDNGVVSPGLLGGYDESSRLALSVHLQQVAMPAVFPQQQHTQPTPFFGRPIPHHDPRFAHNKQQTTPPGMTAHDQPLDSPVRKGESRENSSTTVDNYREDRRTESCVTYRQQATVPSPASLARISSSTKSPLSTVVQYGGAAAHCRFPPAHGLDRYPAQHWHRSPLSSHSSEDTLDEPLQLTVHNRSHEEDATDGDSAREGWTRDSSNGCYRNWTSSPTHTSLPLKFRHKMPTELSPPHATYPRPLCFGKSNFGNGFAHLPDIAPNQMSPLSLVKKDGTCGSKFGIRRGSTGRHAMDLKHFDPKYIERRRRNNEAARKCRENRRNMTRLREAKSEYLESENGKLRNELDSLQSEMKQLRDMLDKKREEQHGQDQEVTPQQQTFSEVQTRRLQQLEEEHRLLQQEQLRLEEQRKQHERDMLQNGLGGNSDHHHQDMLHNSLLEDSDHHQDLNEAQIVAFAV